MTVGVYGLGRFGSFWAETLSRRFTVKGFNRTERPMPAGVEAASENDVLACDTLFLCVAISSMREVLERIGGAIPPGTLVFDTCSVKIHPVELMERFLPQNVSIIGSHPMFGPDSAKNGLGGLHMVLSRVRCPEPQFDEWEGVFESFGLDVIRLTPEEHDREAAWTQGITHFIGRVLADLRLKPSRIATMGYSRLLSVMEQTCNDPWQLFLDLQRYNPYTSTMRQDLQSSLRQILDQLEASLDRSDSPGYDHAAPDEDA